jgi:hypothetical protein
MTSGKEARGASTLLEVADDYKQVIMGIMCNNGAESS